MFDRIESLCAETDRDLLRRYRDAQTPGLCFPRLENRIRVSEQEARFSMALQLSSQAINYSVEHPTHYGDYRFSGAGQRRAIVDLTIHSPAGVPAVNVEFKAKCTSPEARNSRAIRKDLEKLVNEPLDGLWLHILDNTDGQTVRLLAATIRRDLLEALRTIRHRHFPKKLAFHIVLLREQVRYHATLMMADDNTAAHSVEDFFDNHFINQRQDIKD